MSAVDTAKSERISHPHSAEDISFLYKRVEELLRENASLRGTIITLRRRVPQSKRCPHCKRRIEEKR